MQIQLEIVAKVPQLIEWDKIIGFELPGERIEGLAARDNLVLMNSSARKDRLFVLSGMVRDPIVWNDESGAKVIARVSPRVSPSRRL